MMVKQIKSLFQYILFFTVLSFYSQFSFGQEKVDTISQEHLSKIVENISTLYNKDLSRAEKKLSHSRMLKKVDSLDLMDKLYPINKLIVEYEKQKLFHERYILKKREQRSKIIINILSVLFILMALGFIFQYRKRKVYKKKFEELMNEKPIITSHQDRTLVKKKEINVPDEIVREILANLDNFERHHQFISNELTLNILAKKLNTNANYLSKVINHHKGQSFSNYLDKLRVEYAIEELKNNTTFQKFTIKAIAGEVGFKTSGSFAKAFYKSTGIRPSYFIKELEKQS